jgi:hypothetical protein
VVLFVFYSVFSAAALEVLLLLPSVLMSRTSGIAPRVLASENVAATPAASRLAARNAAKPATAATRSVAPTARAGKRPTPVVAVTPGPAARDTFGGVAQSTNP